MGKRKYRQALVELAITMEYETCIDEMSKRARRSLDHAWELVDPTGEIRQLCSAKMMADEQIPEVKL